MAPIGVTPAVKRKPFWQQGMDNPYERQPGSLKESGEAQKPPETTSEKLERKEKEFTTMRQQKFPLLKQYFEKHKNNLEEAQYILNEMWE
jgi:hypothetical protein